MKPDSLLFRMLEFYGTRIEHRGKWWTHFKLRTWLKANIDRDLVVERRGLRWVLNPSDFTQSEFFWTGSKEHWEMYHLLRTLTPPCVIFDVGANFGYYSILLCQALEKRCMIYAFEPNPSVFRRLSKNIEMNGFTEVISPHCLGVSDAEGAGRILLRPGNTGATQIQLAPFPGEGQVALVSLDEFFETQKVARFDFLKIDVEGFEERVLRGAYTSLARFLPLILIELNPQALACQGSSVEGVTKLLNDLGYGLYLAHRERILPLRKYPAVGDYVTAFGVHDATKTRYGWTF